MITKRKGNGQTECYGCKQKGKFALNWDSFLYTFDDKPYCFDCLMEKLEQLYQKNQELKEKIKTYEDQEDLTLMFMYCDEKVKDKIRELKKQLEEYDRKLFFTKNELDMRQKSIDNKLNQQKEFIEMLEKEILDSKAGSSQQYYAKEHLSKYKSIIGDSNE